MNLNQFQYLLALSKHHSMSRAAKSLYITQPAMSVRIRELEDELGYPILIRTRQGIEFTEKGRLVLKRAGLIMDEVRNIYNIGTVDGDDICGTLNIASTPHFCMSLLMDLITDMHRLHPNLNICCHGSDSETIVSRIETGEFQIGVIQLCDVDEAEFFRKVEEGPLSYGRLFSEELCIVANENHPLAQRKGVALAQLTDYTYATFSRATNRKMFSLYRQAGRQDRIIRIGDISALRKYLIEQDPLTVIPRSAIEAGNGTFYGRLCALDVPEYREQCDVVWIHNGSALTPQVLRALEVLSHICRRTK